MSTALAKTPAWPMHPVVPAVSAEVEWLHGLSTDRVRVAKIDKRFFVSIDGDNFAGPFKTADAAQAYGAKGAS